ncbi:tlde1 domain-containing protein [Paraburkholderia sp. Ac-20336]|uniref:tlde1 domain-containing protein n=1 Tax=Paraburkholderia sp. Ac-20336 TaxID=2703886 RepID=UPI0032176518
MNGVERGQFRLHPAGGRGLSKGCITLPGYADFEKIRRAHLHYPRSQFRHSCIWND